MRKTYPIIAKEGWLFVGLAFVAALAATLLQAPIWISVLLWIIFAFVVQFFRDPKRVFSAADPLDILSPADGKVIIVENAKDPYLEREAIRISIFMNVFNVHSNKSPYDGKIIHREYFAGSFLNAVLDKAAEQNERNAIIMNTKHGDITFVQIAGLVARRILCYANIGDILEKGQRYGFIRFGSRVDIYLPTDVTVKVSIGNTVKSALTPIATFKS